MVTTAEPWRQAAACSPCQQLITGQIWRQCRFTNWRIIRRRGLLNLLNSSLSALGLFGPLAFHSCRFKTKWASRQPV